MIFASDNWAGVSERVMAAISEAARGGGPAYGTDPLTKAAEKRFSEIFEREVAVFFVATGTAANALALSAYARPGGFVWCHRLAHIIADEPGSTELFGGGMRLVGLEGAGGRIAPDTFATALAGFAEPNPHFGEPVAVSLSQITELGTAYRPAAIAAIATQAKSRGLAVHMDGARFAGAVAGLGLSPADLTWRVGVDVISFGGTKNGCLSAEAVVFFDRDQARNFGLIRQRAGHTFSKGWFVAAQFSAYFEDGHWLDMARHANSMGVRLADAIRSAPGARLALEPDANEIFAILPKRLDQRLKAAGAAYHPWTVDSLALADRPGADEVLVRFVTSFQTRAEEVDRFAALLAKG
jgi:threonine aldolase